MYTRLRIPEKLMVSDVHRHRYLKVPGITRLLAFHCLSRPHRRAEHRFKDKAIELLELGPLLTATQWTEWSLGSQLLSLLFHCPSH